MSNSSQSLAGARNESSGITASSFAKLHMHRFASIGAALHAVWTSESNRKRRAACERGDQNARTKRASVPAASCDPSRPLCSQRDGSQSGEHSESQAVTGEAGGHLAVGFLVADIRSDVLVHLLQLISSGRRKILTVGRRGALLHFLMINRYELPLTIEIHIAVLRAVSDGVDRHLRRPCLRRRLLRRTTSGVRAVAEQHDGTRGNGVRILRILRSLLQRPQRR